MIGDCETAALVSCDGSIDWLCWPDFSSPACLARLIGTEDNGFWRIAPQGKVTATSREYRDDTLILETTFETADGAVTLVDFMPIRGESSDIVRIVRGVRGRMAMRMDLALRFSYGRVIPWVTSGDDGWVAIGGPDLVVLRSPVKLEGRDSTTVAEFTVREGESVTFVMAYGPSHLPAPDELDAEDAETATEQTWEEWIGRCTYDGPYQAAVRRSLITLKALTYRPTGGIVAAPTTSLPEQLGGPRNWDYRYCWLRDATLTLLALIAGGYYDEANEWQEWLLRAVAGSLDLVQVMYDVHGGRLLVEWEADWLDGYEGSRPVRIGNAAAAQLQLDIYGELLDAFAHAVRNLGKDSTLDFHMLQLLVEQLEKIWREPDEGIWEVRGDRQCFTYSKVMAWVAFDRAITVAKDLGAEAPLERWETVKAEIHADVCANGYSDRLGTFVQAYGSDELDASLLRIPLVGFLPHDDPRVRRTIEAIERELMPHGLVMRYDTHSSDDGLPPGEGTFLACTFWMVSALHLIGRTEDARTLFERGLSLANDVGLLAEEYDVHHKRLVGNFPQALSHIALVNAAVALGAES